MVGASGAQRFASGVLGIAVLLSACVAGDNGGEEAAGLPQAAAAATTTDPLTSFCSQWSAFDALLESDPEPTEELVAQVLDLQAGIGANLPAGLEGAWTGVVEWNQAFIDLFEATGYRTPTEADIVLAFRTEEAGALAAETMEAGFAEIRTWHAESCPDVELEAIAFCNRWSELSALAAAADVRPSHELVDDIMEAIDTTDAAVPAEVRSHWDRWVETARGFRELLATVGYDPERITPDLLAAVFGSEDEAEAAEEAAQEAAAAIEDWSVAGCGTFCVRWPDLRRALDETGHELGWVGEMEMQGVGRLDEYIRSLEVGRRLVPDEVRTEWEAAVAARLDWIEWWRSFDFDWGEVERPASHERALELAQGAEYLLDSFPAGEREAIRAWQEGRGAAPEWMMDHWRGGPNGWETSSQLADWVEDNCEAVSGLPGTVRVRVPRIDGAAGSTLLVALGPQGSTAAELLDPAAIERDSAGPAGWCEGIISDPWEGGEGGSEGAELRTERHDQWCNFKHEQPAPRLEAGTYTLVAAAIAGNWPGDSGGVLTPKKCLEIEVEIDGDTVIDMPPLESCDPGFLPAPPADDPWRKGNTAQPQTPGAGTLRVVVPSDALPPLDRRHEHGDILVMVLPEGTTLNDVGREQVWPSGAAGTWFPHFEEHEARERYDLEIPIATLPPTGSPSMFEPRWLLERPSEDRLPLVVLAPGTYDVYISVEVWNPEIDEGANWCTSFEVTIEGDTRVEAPELEEC